MYIIKNHREGISIECFGFVLFFILPGAFVALPSDAVNALSPFKRLRVSSLSGEIA